FFSGFYSKDVIIEAAKLGAGRAGWIGSYAYWAVLLGAFVTSFYSFRLLYLTYFGEERFRHAVDDDHGDDAHPGDAHGHHGPHEPRESPWVVTVPLVLLAIPSILVGFFTAGPMRSEERRVGQEGRPRRAAPAGMWIGRDGRQW